jgi:hypothetical protein
MSADNAVAPAPSAAVRTAAAGGAGICLAFAGMQVALAAGAPLGEHVWGGSQPRVLPARMRLASAGGAALLVGMATTIAHQGGLVGRPARWHTPATWTIAGYLALNTVGNLASRDDVERRLFAPATAVASTLAGYVALRGRCEGIADR